MSVSVLVILISCLGFIFLVFDDAQQEPRGELAISFLQGECFLKSLIRLWIFRCWISFPLSSSCFSYLLSHFYFCPFFLKDCSMFFSVVKHFLMSGTVFNLQELFLFLIIPSSLHLFHMTAMFALRISFRGGCLLFLSS